MHHQATHFIGIGATKAGTSWLHDYLVSHPDVIAPPIKEVHCFDAYDDTVTAFNIPKMRRKNKNEINRLNRQSKGETAQQRKKSLKRIGRLEALSSVYASDKFEAEAYSSYFAGEAARAGARVTTDITPAYALLSRGWFERMVAAVPHGRFAFILRDPVARLWSNIRMSVQARLDTAEDLRAACLATVDAVLSGQAPKMLLRSDYATALSHLEAFVAPARRMVLFFENMFTQAKMDEFCAFLGLAPHPAQVNKPNHVGVSVKLDETRRAGLSELLAPQYAAVEARFGALPDRWQQNMTKV